MSFKKQTILGLGARGLSMLAGLLSVSLSIRYYGSEAYGAYYSVAAVTAFLTLSDVGIGAGLRNHLAAAVLRNDTDEMRQLISTSYSTVLRYAIPVVVIALLLTFTVPWASWISIPDGIMLHAEVVMVISILGGATTLILSLVNSVAAALGMQSLIGFSTAAGFLLSSVIIVGLGLFAPNANGLVAIAVASNLGPVLAQFIANLYIYRTRKSISPKITILGVSKRSAVVNFGIRVFMINITDQLIFTSGSILVASMFGSYKVAGLAVAQRFFIIIQTILGVVVFTANTKLVQAKESGDKNWILRYLRVSCAFLFAASVLVLLLPVAIPFLGRILAGTDLIFDANLIMAQAIFNVICLWNTFMRTLLIGLSELREIIYCGIAGVLINFSFFYPAAKYWGAAGIVYTACLALLPSVVYLPNIIRKKII